MSKQFTDAFLIVRTLNGVRRVVGTTFSQSEADKSCVALAYAKHHVGAEYHTERNPKYQFNDSLRVVGVTGCTCRQMSPNVHRLCPSCAA